MANKILWDKYEAALLIETYLKIESGEVSKQNAVMHLSHNLRKRAISAGIDIDGTYRNKNGISMRLSEIQYVMTSGKVGIKNTSRLFREMVALYHEDRQLFHEILTEAKKMTEKPIQNQFFSWMSGKVPPAQISELNLTFSEIESFCLKIKVLKKPLFQVTDLQTVAKVMKMIESNKVFRFIYKKQLSKMASAMHFYYLFIKENQAAFAGEKYTVPILKKEVPTEKRDEKATILTPTAQMQPQGNENRTARTDGNESANILFVDFNEPSSYAYTRPVYLKYFGKKQDSLKTWAQMYVQLLQYLFADYPEVINGLKGQSIGKGSRIDIGGAADNTYMTAPKPITEGLYLETNLSASNIVDKIHQLMDLCKVDYTNVAISYKAIGSADNDDIVAQSKWSTPITSKEKTFYAWLTKEQGMAEATSHSYVSAINGVEKVAKERHLVSTNLYGAKDYQEAKETMDSLLCDEAFIAYNDQQHNCFRAAMKKYLQYLAGDVPVIKPKEVSFDLKPYKELLAEKFQKGFRLNSNLDLKRFKRFYEETYETKLDADDETIRQCICRIGVQYQEFVYLPKTMLEADTRQNLLNYIEQTFSDGTKAIYYDALFKKFSFEFQGQRIYSADMLKTYLTYINCGRYCVGRSYLTVDSTVDVDPLDEVKDCMITYGAPMNLDDLYEALPHIPEKVIKWTLNSNKEFIYNASDEYFHADVVGLSENELQCIAAMIQQAVNDKEFMGGNELIEAIVQKYPAIFERLSQFSSVGLRDAIGYKLNGAFSFNGNIISECGKSLSMYDVYADYCKDRQHFTLDELNGLKRELNTTIYFDAVYANSLRISQDNFVAKEQAQFDVERTDTAISRFCTDAYIAIGEIGQFGSFPSAGFPWNGYLLEHYVSDYSAAYKLLHTSFNAYACVGAIVKRDAGIDDFNDLVTNVLANSMIPLNKEGALQYLCDKGFLARRRYSEIDQILIKAKAQRTQKG